MKVPLFDDLFIFACNVSFRLRRPILRKGLCGGWPQEWLHSRHPTPDSRGGIAQARFQGAGF